MTVFCFCRPPFTCLRRFEVFSMHALNVWQDFEGFWQESQVFSDSRDDNGCEPRGQRRNNCYLSNLPLEIFSIDCGLCAMIQPSKNVWGRWNTRALDLLNYVVRWSELGNIECSYDRNTVLCPISGYRWVRSQYSIVRFFKYSHVGNALPYAPPWPFGT